jgi:hypothetical protein
VLPIPETLVLTSVWEVVRSKHCQQTCLPKRYTRSKDLPSYKSHTNIPNKRLSGIFTRVLILSLNAAKVGG